MSPQLVVAAQYTVATAVILWLGSKVKASRPKNRPYFDHHTYDGKPK